MNKIGILKSCLLLSLLVIIICSILLFFDPHMFWNDDYQNIFFPMSYDIGRALSHGEFPLLSPWTWYGGNLAGEYQGGIFSIFELPIYWCIYQVQLPLHLAAALLSVIHLIVLALGVFRLIRSRGLSNSIAIFAALSVSFSGWIFIWGACDWFPAISGLIWVPWFWWSLEKVQKEKWNSINIILPSLFIYLIVASSWHYAILMCFVISGWLIAKNLPSQRFKKLFGVTIISWIIGVGLSSPTWLSFWEFSKYTMRSITNLSSIEYTRWLVPFSAIFGMIQPAFPSIWLDWSLFFSPRVSIELTNGLLPAFFTMSSIYVGKMDFIKKLKPEILLAAGTILLAMFPGFIGFRFSFRWLPLFHLAMAVIAAEGIHYLLQCDTGQKFIKTKFVPYSLLCLTVITIIAIWYNLGMKSLNETFYIWAIVILAIYGLILRRIKIERVILFSIVAISILIIATYTIIPFPYNSNLFYSKFNYGDSLLNHGPLDKQIRYLSMYSHKDLYFNSENFKRNFGDYLKPADTSMFSQVECIQGYSPQNYYSLSKLFSFLWAGQMQSPYRGIQIIRYESGSNGLLALMGVDGIVLGESFKDQTQLLEQNGWKTVTHSTSIHSLDNAIVLERIGIPSPRIRALTAVDVLNNQDQIIDRLSSNTSLKVPIYIWEPHLKGQVAAKVYNQATVKEIKNNRNETVFWVDNHSATEKALILVSRAWYPGFKASLNHRKLPVKVINMIMPAVEIPPGGSGYVTLYFFPDSVTIGLIFSVISILICISLLIWGKRTELILKNL